jgi:hypothetical protein
MAKGQVSEEELAKGLKGIGDFGGLSSSRVRRDNPFRDSRAERPSPEPVKTIEVMPSASEKRASKGPETAIPNIDAKAVRPVARMPKAIPKEKEGEKKAESAGVRKSDIYTEPVTLKISPEMRDDVERIARELQRSKTSKKERITGNTVMRVAIRLITKRFQLNPGQAPNDEEELFELVETALSRRGT